MGRTRAVAFFLLAGAACSGGGTEDGPVLAPTASELAHTTYSGIMNEPVTLAEGRWEGEPFVEGRASQPMVGLVDHFILTGDLNQDGLDEAVALLWESSGGSGTRLFLAVMARTDDAITNIGTALIGDRVQIRSGMLEDSKITLDLVRPGPDDAACCATEKAVVTWALGDGGLTRIGDETTGTLSLTDLGGREWVLLELGGEQLLPAEVEISIVFQDERVSGTSGCNNYFAGVVEPDPSELEFNGMGATRMACPEPLMDLERRYLKVLAGARGYSFLAGYLAINCETDGGFAVLLFSPRKLFGRVAADVD